MQTEFIELFRHAVAGSLAAARPLFESELPNAIWYHVVLNQSYDADATADERVFPEDEGREYSRLSEADTVGMLLRDGMCPAWIDVSVEAQEADHTCVRLLCSGRWTDNPDRMYYAARRMGPFSIKSPDGAW